MFLLPISIDFLFKFEFVQDLLVHSCRPSGIFAWFPLSQVKRGWGSVTLDLEGGNSRILARFLPQRPLSHSALSSRSLNRANSVLLKSGVMSFLNTLLHVLRVLNSTISWSLQPKLPLIFTFSTSTSSLWHSTFPPWLVYHFEKEVSINSLLEHPGLLMPCL